MSLDWRPRAVDAPAQVPVQAMVLDEGRVAEEIAALKQEELRERELERERLQFMEEAAEEAREQRLSEERRLVQVQDELSELQQEHDRTAAFAARSGCCCGR